MAQVKAITAPWLCELLVNFCSVKWGAMAWLVRNVQNVKNGESPTKTVGYR